MQILPISRHGGITGKGRKMTTASRRLENMQTFQRCNAKQHQQELADRLKLITNYVAEYNSRLLDGEPKITIVEMCEQVERKG